MKGSRITSTRTHRHVVPEARVTGRPRIVVVRSGGRLEIPDSTAFALVTIALTLSVMLPAVLGRVS